jgi:phosphoglycolate phosphatase-like HAD superfamily hydrolase
VTLVIFDIDGTLTATYRSDTECYARAFVKVFKASLPTTNWHAYRQSTDSGIIAEALASIRGPPVTHAELDEFEAAFTLELAGAYRADPAGFAEVPGAKTILDEVRRMNDVTVAIASGGFRKPALFKLAAIGVDGNSLPAGFADDSPERSGIIRCAMQRAGGSSGDMVYVGDALWDVRVAAALGMRFIGITWESSEESLVEAGALVCLRDYSDRHAFLEALSSAAVPGLGD